MSKNVMKNRSLIKHLLALAIILGSLILLIGISGIVSSKKLSNHVKKINEAALGPILAFDEIISELDNIKIQLLTLQHSEISADKKEEFNKSIIEELNKIYRLESEQLILSEGQDYNQYLQKWVSNWDFLNKSIKETLEKNNFNNTEFDNIQALHKSITTLKEQLHNIRDFIKHDVDEILNESKSLSQWSIALLSVTLLIGVFIAVFSSSIIIRNIRNLFNEIEETKKSIEILFDNLNEGFLSFDKEGEVLRGVSISAQKLYGFDVVGRKFSDILPVDANRKKQVLAWQELIFSGNFNFDEFKSAALQSYEFRGKYIELDFRPIYAKDQSLEKIICISTDKTNERKLKQIADEETAMVKLVLGIIKDRQSFSDHIDEIFNLIVIVNKELQNPAPDIATLLRAMHSIKSCSASYHILTMVKQANGFESKVAGYIKDYGLSNIGNLVFELKIEIRNIENIFESFLHTNEKIFEALLGKDSNQIKMIETGIINEFCGLLVREESKESDLSTYFIDNFIKEKIGISFSHYVDLVGDLGARFGKIIKVDIQNAELKINPEPYKALFNSFAHIFRNAVDHGIENKSERYKNRKPLEALIEISFNKNSSPNGDTLLIQISDNGRGIDSEKIRDKAISKGLISKDQVSQLSAEECLQLIFINGFSTREMVSEISGRGIGTDIVMNEAKKLGGAVWVKSVVGRGTSFYIEVPMIDFNSEAYLPPAKSYSKVS